MKRSVAWLLGVGVAALATAAVTAQPARTNRPGYAVRCFTLADLERGLNDAYRNRHRLLEMAPATCTRMVNGRNHSFEGYVVVLEH